jgi:hypothetical protein
MIMQKRLRASTNRRLASELMRRRVFINLIKEEKQ